jgi:hypothetical protein
LDVSAAKVNNNRFVVEENLAFIGCSVDTVEVDIDVVEVGKLFSDILNKSIKTIFGNHAYMNYEKGQIQDKEKELKREYKMLKEARQESALQEIWWYMTISKRHGPETKLHGKPFVTKNSCISCH